MTSTVSQARNPVGLQQAEHQSKTSMMAEALGIPMLERLDHGGRVQFWGGLRTTRPGGQMLTS
jgi:hypothetical protein